MDLGEPATVIAPGLTVPLLRALAARSTGMTSEQLRRVVGTGTPAGVRRALERLAAHGLLSSTSVGAVSALYELNRQHVLYPVVQALVSVGDALPRRLAEVIEAWPRAPLSAALFGSAARRDGGAASDVDVLVLRPDDIAEDDPQWTDQLHELRKQVYGWTGNHLQILERTTAELAELVRAGEAIVDEFERDAVTVQGDDLHALLEELR